MTTVPLTPFKEKLLLAIGDGRKYTIDLARAMWPRGGRPAGVRADSARRSLVTRHCHALDRLGYVWDVNAMRPGESKHWELTQKGEDLYHKLKEGKENESG